MYERLRSFKMVKKGEKEHICGVCKRLIHLGDPSMVLTALKPGPYPEKFIPIKGYPIRVCSVCTPTVLLIGGYK